MHFDYLAQLLHQPQLSAGWLIAGIAVAFWLGALHALEPGHGLGWLRGRCLGGGCRTSVRVASRSGRRGWARVRIRGWGRRLGRFGRLGGLNRLGCWRLLSAGAE